ncbi:MAG: mRNA surveillance protein pelota [Candidatus Altiarchaeota archaeon]
MKVIRADLKHGKVTVRIDSLDDLWYLSHIVSEGDRIKSKSVRRIKDKDDKLRSGGGERKTITLTITVEKKEFRQDADTLRFSGLITDGPEDVISVGSHHTINVEDGTVLTIMKDRWSRTDFERLKDAENATLKPKFLVVVVDDGEACAGLVRSSKIDYVELTHSVGGKYITTDRDKRKKEFYSELKDLILHTTAREGVSNMVFAGAGFEKDNFLKYFNDAVPQNELKIAVENTGSHGRRGVIEVLRRAEVGKMLGDLNAARDIRFLEEVLEKIGKGEGLAALPAV